jgi:hypothetical protein
MERERGGERDVSRKPCPLHFALLLFFFFFFSFFFFFFFFGKVNFTKKFEPIFNLILNVLIFAMHLPKFIFFFNSTSLLVNAILSNEIVIT